jgi:hypothetical protein
MAPSFVLAKQIENYKIWKEDKKKSFAKPKKARKQKQKIKNPELKLKSHLEPKLELKVFLNNPRT